MYLRHLRTIFLGLLAAVSLLIGEAQASLAVAQSFVGNYAVSSAGWGSTTQTGTIQAQVPAGATVVAAYLYTSTYGTTSLAGVGGTLQGNAITYTSLGTNTPAGDLTAGRADVTSIVKPVIDGGPGGTYNFAITETSSEQDGSALVVVYQKADLPLSTVAIMDGFSAIAGDTASINFATPLNPAAPGFFAELRLGIGFSCCDQASQVSVNGTTITTNAGNNDDSADASFSNGNLITVGGFNDPFSTLLPSYADDHERYNIVPQINLGDASIVVDTANPAANDNIFLAIFHVAGAASINEPPPPPSPTQVTAIPTLSEWGMIVMSGLIVLATFVTLRRRNA